MSQEERKPYGRFPQELRKYAVQMYEGAKPYSRVSPYVLIANMFGCTDKRVQQVVYEQRKLQEARDAVPLSVISAEGAVGEAATRPEPGPDGAGNPPPF